MGHDGIPHPSLVNVQHDVRAHFGWSYEGDLESALGLQMACDDHPAAQRLGWLPSQREETLRAVETILHRASTVVVVGAAVETAVLEQAVSMKGPFLWLQTGPLAHVWAGSMSHAWSRTLTVSLTSPTPHEKVFPSSFTPTETTRKHGENASTDGRLRAGHVWCSRTRRTKQFRRCTTREGLPTATERHVSFLGWTSP